MSDLSENTKAYTILANIYDTAGFVQFTGEATEMLITFLQKQGWLGRRVLELGCGTGESTVKLASISMEVTAIDACPPMLELAQQKVSQTSFHVNFINGDFRQVAFPDEMDLVLAPGSIMNELKGLREFEALARKIHAALSPEKLFVFDIWTLRGLAENIGNGDVIHNLGSIFIGIQNEFNYDSMALKQQIFFFVGRPGTIQRGQVQIVLRSFPVSALLSVLNRVGFDIQGTYTPGFKKFNSQNDKQGQVLIVAQRKA